MEIVQIAGIVSAVVIIVVLAYLYRESALIEGKSEVGIGPWKFSLGGRAQKKAEVEPSPANIEQSGPEIQGDAGEIKQSASGGGVIEDSAPKVS